jgi:hypothetical protein
VSIFKDIRALTCGSCGPQRELNASGSGAQAGVGESESKEEDREDEDEESYKEQAIRMFQTAMCKRNRYADVC